MYVGESPHSCSDRYQVLALTADMFDGEGFLLVSSCRGVALRAVLRLPCADEAQSAPTRSEGVVLIKHVKKYDVVPIAAALAKLLSLSTDALGPAYWAPDPDGRGVSAYWTFQATPTRE